MASGKCDVCEKRVMFGRNIRHKHSGRWEREAPKTNRMFRPNLHRQLIHVAGQSVRVKLCTRCLRTQSKRPIA